MNDQSFGIIPLVREEDGFWVLLVHQKNGNYWGFPKGHLEGEESKKEAAERELYEEVGLEVFEYLSSQPFKQSYSFKKGSQKISKEVELYAAITTSEYVIASEEIIEAKWLRLRDAEQAMTYEEGKETIRQLQRRLPS